MRKRNWLEMLKAILFDLGDTLIDFEPMDSRRVFQEGARSTHSYLVEKGHNMPSLARYWRRQYRAVRWAYVWAKLRRREFNTLHLLGRVCRRMGVSVDEATAMELAWRWYEPVMAHSSMAPDVMPTLRFFARRGLKLGLISNTFVPGAVLDRHLERVGLLPLLPVRVYSADVGHRKPSRAIFRDALDQLAVAPREALFVGDLVKTDIVGARRMGMTTVLRQPFIASDSHRIADHVIRRISDLCPIVERLSGNEAPPPPVELMSVAIPAADRIGEK